MGINETEMSRQSKYVHKSDNFLIEVKSKFDAEFRRFSVDRQKLPNFDEFAAMLESSHQLADIAHTICYTDPIHGDLLPINNDDNYGRAILAAKPLLRVLIQRKGESWEERNGYGVAPKKKNFISQVLAVGGGGSSSPRGNRSSPHLAIGLPEDFRQVSAIIDVDLVPDTCRRVRLLKHGSDRPLGFYIRDGTSVRVTPQGLDKVPGIFISRLVPGGLAESTGLLAVNDEVLEVNGIEVAGRSLDQVTDMMVANSANLIVTVKPANQRNGPVGGTMGGGGGHHGAGSGGGETARGSFGKASQLSAEEGSQQSLPSDDDRFDQDEIRDLTGGLDFLEEVGGEGVTILGGDPEGTRYRDGPDVDDSDADDEDGNKHSDDGIVTL